MTVVSPPTATGNATLETEVSSWRKHATRAVPRTAHQGSCELTTRQGSQQRDVDPQRFFEALFRTRTGDPLLTMEVLYQLS
jgi:hypothetical protein